MRLSVQNVWQLVVRTCTRTKGALGLAFTLVIAFAGLTGCTPSIGDSCALSTDCATDGTRICDTSEPGGFCTVINCTGNLLGSTCPDNALCVLFNDNVPGCPFSAYSPSRISASQCRNSCNSDSDCRASYICALPTTPPWSAEILDPNQTIKVCLPALAFVDGGIGSLNYGYDGALDAIPAVCQAAGPMFDAGFPPLDGGVTGDAAPDAAPDGRGALEAGAPDAGPDATADAAKNDGGTPDSGPHDATVGDATMHAATEAGDAHPADAHPADAHPADAHPG
jgi:hypothetical protein